MPENDGSPEARPNESTETQTTQLEPTGPTASAATETISLPVEGEADAGAEEGEDPKEKPVRRYDVATRAQILTLAANKNTMDSIFRITGMSRSAVSRLVKNAQKRGFVLSPTSVVKAEYVKDLPRSGRPRAMDEDAEKAFIDDVVAARKNGARADKTEAHAEAHGISSSTALRALKNHKIRTARVKRAEKKDKKKKQSLSGDQSATPNGQHQARPQAPMSLDRPPMPFNSLAPPQPPNGPLQLPSTNVTMQTLHPQPYFGHNPAYPSGAQILPPPFAP